MILLPKCYTYPCFLARELRTNDCRVVIVHANRALLTAIAVAFFKDGFVVHNTFIFDEQALYNCPAGFPNESYPSCLFNL